MNTPEANRAIIAVIKQKHAFNLARAEIVRQYTADRLSPEKRDKALLVANEAMAALENDMGIAPAVQQVLAQYKTTASPDVKNNQNNKPPKLIWNGSELVEEEV